MKSIQLFLKNEHIIKRIKVNQITYIKIKNRYVLVHLPKQKVITSSITLSDFEKILPEYFMRIHRNCIVNSHKIIEFDTKRKKILLINGKELDVSVRNVKKLKDFLDPTTFNLQ